MARTPDVEQRNRVWEWSVEGRPTAQIQRDLENEFGQARAYQPRTIQKILIRYHRDPEWKRQRGENMSGHGVPVTPPQFQDSQSDFSLVSLESNGLPVEASGPLMDLLRIINSDRGRIFKQQPSRQYLKITWCYAKWYWKLSHCTPGLTEEDRFILAVVCCVKEIHSPESLEEIESYLTWQPWRSASAHREYLRRINMSQIKYVDWLEWWVIIHLSFDDSSEGIDGYKSVWDAPNPGPTPVIFPHPELDLARIDDDIRQPLFTPSQGLAVVKLDLVLNEYVDIDWDEDPSVVDVYDTDPIGELTQEELTAIRERIASDWDEWIPYRYDYSALEGFAQLLTEGFHTEFVWKSLMQILPKHVIVELGFIELYQDRSNSLDSNLSFYTKYVHPYLND